MNKSSAAFFSILIFSLTAGPIHAQEAVQIPSIPGPDEIFSTKGTVNDVNEEEKSVHVKIEGGLELTFYVINITTIELQQETRNFSDLHSGAEVAIDYFYDESYRKVAKVISIVSAGKTEAPPV